MQNTATSELPIDAGASSSPWDTAAQAAPAAVADPWLSTPEPASAPDTAAPAADWLDAPAGAVPADDGSWQIQQLWDGSLPVEAWINQGLGWVVQNFRPFFQTVRVPIDSTLTWVEALLQSVPSLAMVALFGLLAWQFAGRAVALGTLVSLAVVVLLGIWPEAMVTLSLVLTSLVFCLVLGLPLGILLASSDRAQRILRPLLDAMQTTPAFVYLVPVVMLFGIGNVPGVIVTIVFALPPLVRLTNLGIRQVRPDLIEAALAYGASPAQMLLKVQLPLAMPSIMAGVNQTLMLSLSMVVIASMIAVGGLGQMVLRGIGRLDMGLATVGGLGIVLLAISLDRITQAAGQPQRGVRHWWQTGPAGLVWRLLRRSGKASDGAGQPAPQHLTSHAH
ncbi:MAG: glycine betaine/L-proline ABC transporter permease ProW [Oxalobacteraceae bacterium]|nr:glycine betaine/L-proline ABC transporter permease ProW [Oxalobacteraceae bacterium]